MRKKSLSSDFNGRARRMKPDAPFDLDGEIARAYREFPKLKGSTYFIDACTGRLIHPNFTAAMDNRVTKHWNVQRALAEVQKHKRSFFYPKHHFKDFPGGVIYLYLDIYATNQKKREVFDHELGHAVTLRTSTMEEKLGENIAHETAAEVFMLIRQFARYGRSKHIDANALMIDGAIGLILGKSSSEDYFAAPAMEKVIEMEKSAGLANMPPHAIVELSRKLAAHYTPTPAAIRTLKEELKPVRDMLQFHNLAKKTLKTTLPDAFKWGSRVLRHKMGAGYSANEAGAEEFKAQEWPLVQKQLVKRGRFFAPRVTSKRRA